MAKTPKPKTTKTKSPHSRSSRRAASPSLNIDKSLTTLPRPRSQNPLLAPRTGGGVSKNTSGKGEGRGSGERKGKGRAKVLKRKQKIRIERGRDRAEVVGDQVERKRGMGRRGVGRNADWDEFNERIGGRKGKGRKAKKGKGDDGEGGLEDGGMDVDVDGGKGGTLKDGAEGVDVMNAVDEEIL